MLHFDEMQATHDILARPEEIEALLYQERRQRDRFTRMGRGITTTDTMLGGIVGACLAIILNFILSSGLLPGLTTLPLLGAGFPMLLGVTLVGLGSTLGSFIDLYWIANMWRE